MQRYALCEHRQKVAHKIAEQSSRFVAPTFRLTHILTHCLHSQSAGRGNNRLNESFFSRSVAQMFNFLNYFIMEKLVITYHEPGMESQILISAPLKSEIIEMLKAFLNSDLGKYYVKSEIIEK